MQHDPDDKGCTPGGSAGNFIMYDKATTGDRPNNDRFSSCSIKSIETNVNDKRGRYKDCFIKFTEKICGNQVREKGEQCDCGDEDTCGQNSCCGPAGPKATECRLKAGNAIKCDPSQGVVMCFKLLYSKMTWYLHSKSLKIPIQHTHHNSMQ